MKNVFFFLFALLFVNASNAQANLNALLKKHNSESVPYIHVTELANENLNEIVLIDAREKKEFDVSHIENAVFSGYDYFNLKKTTKNLNNKSQKIVVYCSLGIRSEDIAEKLKNAGYTNVYNLYGGIFEWKNQAQKVVDKNEKETQKVHTFSKEWSKWLVKGEKIYEH
jgi:rhodanese-related sulfurtransferase